MALNPDFSITKSTKRDWLNPLNKIVIHRAVKAGDKRATLEDGRIISLDYDKWPGKVFIKPIPTAQFPSPFVPCGYFSLEVLRSSAWLEV